MCSLLALVLCATALTLILRLAVVSELLSAQAQQAKINVAILDALAMVPEDKSVGTGIYKVKLENLESLVST